jgi:hydrogenase nickel incorporation protein HypA/HybF
VKDLLHRVEAAARQAGAQRVSGVHVWLGALTSFSPEHFREHFEEEAQGTLAEGAQLTIEVSEDEADAGSQQIVMRSIDLEV